MYMWLKFGDIYKIIYPISTVKVKLTEKELETEDENKWVEVPDDYLGTKLDDISDIKGDFVIVIEKKKQDDSWPRAKGENWRETLQTGDIIIFVFIISAQFYFNNNINKQVILWM